MSLQTNIVVALPSEARALISKLRLQPQPMPHGLKLYSRGDCRLLISGVGKIASASAVGVLAGMSAAADRQLWLNVGIAGHAKLPIGEMAIAHSVIDVATGSQYYPSVAFQAPFQSVAVHCFDKPTTNYPVDALCDMESAGFFAAASRYCDVEFVHVVKIVSDNCAADINALDRGKINNLVNSNADAITSLIDQLQEIDQRHRRTPDTLPTEALLAKWHFTVTQQAQLRELARRWALVVDDMPWPPMTTLDRCAAGSDVLACLGDLVNSRGLQLLQAGRDD